MALLIETALGDIVIDLDYEGSPVLTRNLLQLAKANAYKGNLIYKVLPQRFCMTGCPVGDGSGGTSIQGLLKGSKTALSTSTSRLLSPLEMQEKGRVAVQGQSMGSQFLITIDQGKDHALDGIEGEFYSVGVVAEDDNHVLDKINAAYLDPNNNRPFADIRILSALVVYDPFEKEHSAELKEYIERCPSASPERPSQETVEKRISIADIDMDENDDDNSSVDERKQKMLHEEELQREAQSRAVVLEMLGDLPSADMKAPENVLFICKLNPVTTDEDLELIFSRFDQAVKVEIIRDHDTGDSLQYAFAEFTTPKQAQEAYFKMNHALVDDRRILVDFSQSVAKLWDKYHQKMKFSHKADTYQSHRRHPRRPDDRSNPSNHHRGNDRHQGQGHSDGRGREGNVQTSQWRQNDQKRSSDYSEANRHRNDHRDRGASEERHRRARYHDDREKGRNKTDEDSYGRHRQYRDDHRSHKDHAEKRHSKESSHRRDRGGDDDDDDDARRRRDEEWSSEDDGEKRRRDGNRHHKRERGDIEDRSHKRGRDNEERRHRSHSEKKRHKSSRHDEDRRSSRERGENEDKARKSHRDEGERHGKDRDEKRHSRYRYDESSYEKEPSRDGASRRDRKHREERRHSRDRNEGTRHERESSKRRH